MRGSDEISAIAYKLKPFRFEPPKMRRCPDKKGLVVWDFSMRPLYTWMAEGIIGNSIPRHFSMAAGPHSLDSLAVAIACGQYKKSVTFFVPTRKLLTPVQHALTVHSDYCDFVYHPERHIPSLSRIAQRWLIGAMARAEEPTMAYNISNAFEGHLLASAALYRLFKEQSDAMPTRPKEIWYMTEGSILPRIARMAWPKAMHYVIHPGKANRKDIPGKVKHLTAIPEPQFAAGKRREVELDTIAQLDGRAYDMFLRKASPRALFINTGSDRGIRRIRKVAEIPRTQIESQVATDLKEVNIPCN
ncbi:MAG: hypothetical protein OXU36_10660 [Candidatus Poribacteria bacterium]|nr:hypothetical protein [Candidatus Poribacteria bacterium]